MIVNIKQNSETYLGSKCIWVHTHIPTHTYTGKQTIQEHKSVLIDLIPKQIIFIVKKKLLKLYMSNKKCITDKVEVNDNKHREITFNVESQSGVFSNIYS